MSEKKQVRDDSLEKTAGGADAGRMIYRFKCSCGNVVMMGKNEAPKFPCPKCMKKEWEYLDTISAMIRPGMEAKKEG